MPPQGGYVNEFNLEIGTEISTTQASSAGTETEISHDVSHNGLLAKTLDGFYQGCEAAAPPNLSDALDYRLYLAAFYEYRRKLSSKELRPYSYAVFSAAADIKSPNYLKLIIDGKRNLSSEMTQKFAKAMGLNKEQSLEFQLLVEYNQATDPAERNLRLKELAEFRVRQQIQSGQIDAQAFSKVPNWVTWVLYAMMDQQGVSFSVEDLRGTLRGKATTEEIETAVKALIHSGAVIVDEVTGQIRKNRERTDAPQEIPVSLIRKIQSQLMFLGLESLFHDGPTEREFGTLTLALTRTEFEELKFKLRQLRKAVYKDNSIRRLNSAGERVYQLNLQLFPISNPSIAETENQ